MKYLKAYESYSREEGKEELIDTIKDILVECKEIGLDIFVYEPDVFYVPSIKKEVDGITIDIEHNPSIDSNVSFKYKDISSSVNHLIEYMKNIAGYNNFLYKDDYIGFNSRGLDICAPNILPSDTDDIGIVKIIFYNEI